MTEEQRKGIISARQNGIGYASIAKESTRPIIPRIQK